MIKIETHLNKLAKITRGSILGGTSLKEIESGFRKWVKKLSADLEKDKVDDLTDSCRWLSYWLHKALDKDLAFYPKFEVEARSLFEDSALHLLKQAILKLGKASKHREGSKVRLREITRFAYHYSHYIHPLLRESGRNSLAIETLNNFNTSYMSEIVMYGEKLEGNWPVFLIRLSECYDQVGIPLDYGYKEYFIDVLCSRKKPPELNIYYRVLDEAERSNQPITKGILVCTALRMWVSDLCLNYGAELTSSFLSPSSGFDSWDFSEMLGYLKSIGRASIDDVIRFASIDRALFQMIGREGYIEPSQDELDDALKEAWRFISFNDGEFSLPENGNDDLSEKKE